MSADAGVADDGEVGAGRNVHPDTSPSEQNRAGRLGASSLQQSTEDRASAQHRVHGTFSCVQTAQHSAAREPPRVMRPHSRRHLQRPA